MAQQEQVGLLASETSGPPSQRTKLATETEAKAGISGQKQGDQIGRIFSDGRLFTLSSLLKITEVGPHFWAIFFSC
jgi:hypothetical protein